MPACPDLRHTRADGLMILDRPQHSGPTRAHDQCSRPEGAPQCAPRYAMQIPSILRNAFRSRLVGAVAPALLVLGGATGYAGPSTVTELRQDDPKPDKREAV